VRNTPEERGDGFAKTYSCLVVGRLVSGFSLVGMGTGQPDCLVVGNHSLLLGMIALLYSYHRFVFSTPIYVLVFLGAIMMLVGGHYTFGKVPGFGWLAHLLGTKRNPFDRVGHVLQGMIPAVMAQELLLRKTVIRPFLAACAGLCAAMTISAGYELIEFVYAYAHGPAADLYLGTQGDPWDPQWDIYAHWEVP
jgi:putative membrane protein